MEDLLKAALLGIVQGLTEFLPVSSTGHLVATGELLGVSEDEFGLGFDAAIHLGTLFAVLLYFRVLVMDLARAWALSVVNLHWNVSQDSRVAWFILLATIPAAIAGVLVEGIAQDAFRSTFLVGVMMLIFSLPMLAAERFASSGRRDMSSLTVVDAVLIGIAQALALVPGVSRSGISISAGMGRGFDRTNAATFAFLLSGPIIAAASFKQFIDAARSEAFSSQIGLYLVGLITAAVVGYAAIAFFLKFLKTNSLIPFVLYRTLLGIVLILSSLG